jgi:hypothetical protein
MILGVTTSAETIRSVTLDDLFARADQVAIVKVVAGDSEHYETAVYKSVVESAYKGTKEGDVLFFGPYLGAGIGLEYVLFLRRGPGEAPNVKDGLSFGEIKSVSREMYEGYATLPVGYDCVFDRIKIKDQCDDSVQLNPDQVILPKSIQTFPKGDPGPITNYKKWVRKSAFLSELGMLSASSRLEK